MPGYWISSSGQRVPVIAVATHDTASAVVASLLQDENWAYLSSCTWSLIGAESRTPFGDSRALTLNITNEGSVNSR